MIGTEFEELLRRIIREEIAKVLDGGAVDSNDDDVRRLAIERAARMRAARAGGRR